MCDTILAPPSASAGGAMLFGKNSDRHRNEAQTVEYFARAVHAADARVTCTHIEIAEVAHTHATLLCRPFWLWGAEMGANEHGVVIGNEAVRARSPSPQEKALIGMDLVRLGLERASSAEEAVAVITDLLQRYGQGGDCGYLKPSYYHNSFIIADAGNAFVLETIGREWLVERPQGIRTISNRYSIERDPHRISAGLGSLLREYGLNEASPLAYASLITDPNTAHIGNAGARQACSTALLSAAQGRLDVAVMIDTLRDHGTGQRPVLQWHAECIADGTLCMHAGDEHRPAQTVGSMVSELRADGAVHWITGTAAPCISIFKPVLMDVAVPEHGPLPGACFDARSLWWRHERMHRAAVIAGFGAFLETIRQERDAMEAGFRQRVRAVCEGGDKQDRAHVIAGCWRDAMEAEDRWYLQVAAKHPEIDNSRASIVAAWKQLSELAGVG